MNMTPYLAVRRHLPKVSLIRRWQETVCLYLVGHQLQESGVVVSLVSDVALGPHQVPHHQTEEEDEAEEVCPDVDSLVVQGEDALYTALVAQTDRPVAGVY